MVGEGWEGFPSVGSGTNRDGRGVALSASDIG